MIYVCCLQTLVVIAVFKTEARKSDSEHGRDIRELLSVICKCVNSHPHGDILDKPGRWRGGGYHHLYKQEIQCFKKKKKCYDLKKEI